MYAVSCQQHYFLCNALILSALLIQAEKMGKLEEANLIKRISLIAWRHVNFLGRFDFQKRHQHINIDEIINALTQRTEWQQLENTEATAGRESYFTFLRE